MEKLNVQIVDTGVANISSIRAAFRRLGCDTELTRRQERIASADHLVLPGVGTFAAAMQMINSLELRQCLVDRINQDRPTLAICLGLQLLCSESEESPRVDGLNIVSQRITRFSNEVQVPQLGWNRVEPKTTGKIEGGEAYFANSFRLESAPEGWNYGTTHYDGEFVSMFWRSNILACQFHPELSGAWGQSLLRSWLECDLC